MVEGVRAQRRLAGALVLVAIALVLWVRTRPLTLQSIAPAERGSLTFTGADGREYFYLAGYDSYDWLRQARNLLRTGTACDAVADGECRDTYTRAPIGARLDYPRSLHVAAIAALHRLASYFNPSYPLSASAFLVPVLVAALGVLPAFAIGQRLAGAIGGLCAALAIGMNPTFLVRSATGDNDVWNVVLPLVVAWAAIGAASSTSAARQAAYAAMATVVTGLHALTWRGWAFTTVCVLAGLASEVAVLTAGAVARRGTAFWRAAEVRRAARALAFFVLFPLLLALPTGRSAQLWTTIAQAPAALASALSARAQDWPDAFETVGELRRPSLREIAALNGDAAYFFAGWLGLILLVLPRRHWRPPHFAILIAGNFLYWYLLARASPSRTTLLLLLVLPLAAVLLWRAIGDADRPAEESPGAVLIVVWFTAALYLAFDGARFALLLAAPFGIAFGVAVGRLGEWLHRAALARGAPARAAGALPLLLAAIVVLVPLQRGLQTTRGFRPRVNDAWWNSLSAIRDGAPADAIVHVWWPYGFWTKYGAERAVSADGASLPTHVPYWLARALLAPSETETLGLLRMLGCGSDTTPADGKERGAFYTLFSNQLDIPTAQQLVLALATSTRGEGAELLARQRLGEETRAQVLDAMYCAPAPAYLVLSDDMINSLGWRRLGNWSFRNAYVAKLASTRPESEAIAEITRRFALPEAEATALYRRAATLGGEGQRAEFISPSETLFTPTWVPCRKEGDQLSCPLHVSLPAIGAETDAFVYSEPSPQLGRLRWRRHRNAAARESAPGEVLLPGRSALDPFRAADPIDARLAVLVDAQNRRVLVGTPAILRSTFVGLMFLDGRYAPRFEKVAEHTAPNERVVTWRIDWD